VAHKLLIWGKWTSRRFSIISLKRQEPTRLSQSQSPSPICADTNTLLFIGSNPPRTGQYYSTSYRGQFLCPIGLRQLQYLEKIVLNVSETSHVSLLTPSFAPVFGILLISEMPHRTASRNRRDATHKPTAQPVSPEERRHRSIN
jgi:hypothetical protein